MQNTGTKNTLIIKCNKLKGGFINKI